MVIKYDKEVADLFSLPPIRPEGFGISIPEFCEEKHCSKELARTILNKAVSDGVLECTQMRAGRGRPMIYYKVGTYPKVI